MPISGPESLDKEELSTEHTGHHVSYRRLVHTKVGYLYAQLGGGLGGGRSPPNDTIAPPNERGWGFIIFIIV